MYERVSMPRVLIVEDSMTQAIQFRMMLEEASYEVSHYVDGAQALEAVKDVQPDIVLTDMDMPIMNGLELVNSLRFQYPSIPTVLMTAHGSDELAVRALEAGAAAYVPKSKLDEMLLGTLEQVLGLIRANRSYANLIECLNYNEFDFTIHNDPALIEPLVDLMQQMLSGMNLCDTVERVRVGMALEHALANAMLHGNLELSREEIAEDEATAIEGLRSEVEERQTLQPYADRRIHFHAKMSTTEATFVIRDEGNGFDTSIVPTPGDDRLLERDGGQGLVLMTTFMSDVRFNDKGNEVTLFKQKRTVPS
jgi:CheY-like chemotaxis protein